MTFALRGNKNRFEKASVAETDDAAEKRRKLALIVIALVTCLTGIVSSVRAFIAEGLSMGAVLSGIFVGIVGGAALLFFLAKRFVILLYGFLFAILGIPTIFFWSEGGLAGQAGVGILMDQSKGLFDPGFTEENGRGWISIWI